MGVLSTAVGSIYKRVNEYYNCGMSINDSLVHFTIQKVFKTEYPIEDMPTREDLIRNIVGRIEMNTGYRTKLIRSNIDFIEVYSSINREIGYFYVIPRNG